MSTTTRREFAVTGMHCGSCGLLIDDEVEEVPGVVSCTTDVRKGRTVVECDGPVDPAAVVAAVAEAGYTARPLD
ncbi:cation transporter [Streptomyces sp. NPDC051567]|uniref:cation transporter n=1 Tax=Streptomyces sp. NPDC051567 TaxID=3365660 RepID=UPI0037BCCB8A